MLSKAADLFLIELKQHLVHNTQNGIHTCRFYTLYRQIPDYYMS
jgi:hypothetical protein